jgi:hypothetical protein
MDGEKINIIYLQEFHILFGRRVFVRVCACARAHICRTNVVGNERDFLQICRLEILKIVLAFH